jgi:protein O-GlcNAc transferase
MNKNKIEKGSPKTRRNIHNRLWLYLCLCICFFLGYITTATVDGDGLTQMMQGQQLFHQGLYNQAAPYFWQAILSHSSSVQGGGESYTLNDALLLFIQCYTVQGKQIEAFVFIARESFRRRQYDIATVYVNHALELNVHHKEAQEIAHLLKLIPVSASGDAAAPQTYSSSHLQKAVDLYSQGLQYFENKQYAEAARVFDEACALSQGNMALGPACTNAVYCRANIMDWGYNGTQFVKDMELITSLTWKEVHTWRSEDDDGVFYWKQVTSVHPHMMLGYPNIDPMLKRFVAESFAIMDERLARVDSTTHQVTELPPHLPYNQTLRRADFVLDAVDPTFKIRVGFVSSGFNSKAVLYLAHDIFRFFDPQKFEIHIFSLGAPDNPAFIQLAMRGVDWRERVKANVDFFHDVQYLKDRHIDLAEFIYNQKIHILIEWDGYARQGLRAQGLFALKPAPILILHQEFLGTTGGTYVDYIVTDPIASPLLFENLYTEKFLYLPHHFFVKGHAVQAEIQSPSYDYSPHQDPYILGTGSPQSNRCLAPSIVGSANVSFVYCNFNKFLKYNPDTVRSWIDILRNVPNSILCLLENPASGVPFLQSFIQDVAETSDNNDGQDLNSRIHFLMWEANPFDHQKRNRDFCNIILDSHPYNGHTTAQDALYAGVPIVTRSDGVELSSRVTTSANIVLGLSELNGNSISEYVQIATKLGIDGSYFNDIRRRLIRTCLQRDPYHPYWDTRRYTKNLERGFEIIWQRYLAGLTPHHVTVIEDQDIERGSNDADIKDADEVRRLRKNVYVRDEL